MARPLHYSDAHAFQEPVIQALRPATSGVVQHDHEVRFILPFELVFESLMYIGLVSRETWRVHPHCHDHFELCYVDEGEGWFALDGFSYYVKKGDLFITKPWEVHHGAARGDTPYHLYYLGFELKQMRNLEADYYQLDIQRVCADQEDCIRSTFYALFTELQEQQPYTLEMIQSLFLRLLVSVLRLYRQVTPEQASSPRLLSQPVREALNYLHGSHGLAATIDTLAEHVHLSRSQITREFKDCMGVSPGQYMRTLCLEWARLYLRESTDSISQIAEHLHFPSIHAFSLFFKRHTGLSPQEYRQQATQHLRTLPAPQEEAASDC